MSLSDTRLRAFKPTRKVFSESDGGGLYIEVLPTGKKRWGLKYRLPTGKQETIRLGDYPAYSLADARSWRENCKALSGRGISPMALKRGDQIPDNATPAVTELAQAFIRNWCLKAIVKIRAREAETKTSNTIEAFARHWYKEIAEPANSDPRNILRILEKDVIPAIGTKQITEVTVSDILEITDKIKNRGADQMALQTRNVLKRMLAYAITREKIRFNPAAAIEAKYIAQAKSRDVALTTEEIGRLLRVIYQSNMKRTHKLALHLLILCMIRKSELIEAKWEELNLEKAEWKIPAERMKKEKSHFVPLSRQAVAIFEELQVLSSASEWIFPSRNDLHRPICRSTLNCAIRALEIDVRDFVIHDFRRTASTHLHEAGFNSDWIEKCLAHTTKGIRGVYNRAQYADQRREMLQWWSDFVDNQIQDERNKVIIGDSGKAYQASK